MVWPIAVMFVRIRILHRHLFLLPAVLFPPLIWLEPLLVATFLRSCHPHLVLRSMAPAVAAVETLILFLHRLPLPPHGHSLPTTTMTIFISKSNTIVPTIIIPIIIIIIINRMFTNME